MLIRPNCSFDLNMFLFHLNPFIFSFFFRYIATSTKPRPAIPTDYCNSLYKHMTPPCLRQELSWLIWQLFLCCSLIYIMFDVVWQVLRVDIMTCFTEQGCITQKHHKPKLNLEEICFSSVTIKLWGYELTTHQTFWNQSWVMRSHIFSRKQAHNHKYYTHLKNS